MPAPTWVDFYNTLMSGAQQNSIARASDGTAGIAWSRTSDQYKALGSSPKKGKSFMDRAWNDNMSVGKRIIDVLSRGNYASASAVDAFLDNIDNPNIGESAGILAKAAWKGLSGKNKITYQDVLKEHDTEHYEKADPISRFVVGTGLDIALDPTTYMGVGLLGKAGRAFKKTGKTAKITEQSVQPTLKRAAEEMGTTGKATVPVGKADDFIRDVTRNLNNPGDAFDNVVVAPKPEKGRALVGNIIPEGERTFTAGPEGLEEVLTHPDRIYNERFMLPGATAPVVAERASMEALNDMVRGIPKFHYGSDVDALDEGGFFRERIERRPINDVPQVRPVGTTKPDDEWADLPEVTNPNPIRNAILRKNDEPVFGAYEKAVDSNGVEYFRPVEGAPQSTVGELRRIIAATNDPRAKAMLLNHIKTVEQYANNLAKKGADITGYGTAKGYIKDVYPEEWEAARVALGGRAKPKMDLSPLPEGPMKIEPTFEEIKHIDKMDFIDKMIYMHQFEGVLEPKDISYLASASNQKSFATRMQKIKNRVSEQGVKDVNDLIDAIDTGKIQSVDEPGLKEVMDHFGAKTLKGLSTKLKQKTERLTKAEKKMLGEIETNAVTKASVSAGDVKELGPTGKNYAAYEGTAWEVPFVSRTAESLANAQKIAAEKVQPAAELVRRVKEGDKTPLAKVTTELSVPQAKIFDHALKLAMDADVIQPRNKELWAYATKRGVKRTHKTPGVGRGRHKGAWNKYSQYTFFRDLMSNAKVIDPAIKDILDSAGIRGADRASARSAAMYDVMMPVLKSVDDVLKQGGIFPVADRAIHDNPFSLYDALRAMEPEFAKKYIFSMYKPSKNAKAISKIAPTQFMDVMNYVVDIIKQGDPVTDDVISDIKDLLMEQQTTNAGKNVPNGLAMIVSKMKDPVVQNDFLEEMAQSFVDAAPEVVQATEMNIAARKIFHEEQVTKGTKESLEALADTITDPTVSPADIAGLADSVKPKIVDKVTRLHGIDPDDAWMVNQEVLAKMPDLGMGPEVAAQGRVMNEMAKAKTPSAKISVGVKAMEMVDEEFAKIAEDIGIPLSDLGSRFEGTLGYRMLKAFSPHLGNKDVRPYFLDRKSLTQTLMRGYQGLISDINRKHTKDAIQAAWKEAQAGTRSSVPEIAAAQDDIQQAINTFFSKDPDYNFFARNNITADNINSHFDHYKIPDQFRFTDDNLNDAWRTWDTEDPLDLLAKTQAAAMGAMAKRMLGDDLTRHFGSLTKKEGYVKLSSHNSVLAKYIDLNRYYPRDVAKQFKVLDDFLKKADAPKEFNALLNLLDNVLHSYKAGMTIYRPGHHARNMVGDVWLSHMAGVNNPIYYTKAAKIMAAYHGRYRDFDAIQALMARQPVNAKMGRVGDSGETIVKIRIGGKSHDMSMGDVYRAAYDQGILNDYRTLEDIQMGAENAFQKFKPFGGKVQKAASSFSEARDHYVRLAHFMNDLEKGRFSSVDEAITKAAHNVRKWHPDGSDLSHFESGAMRRTFLFYSWIRKAIPLVVESMVMKPGKFMMYPKAVYNMAEANGIDLDSMSNPFPTDQLFPDWITDSPIGPIAQNAEGHYLGFNPGVPSIDVLNDYAGSQAGMTALGSLNPFLKIPIELGTALKEPAVARDLRTGIKSYDLTDYIDRQIPGGTYATGITGRSISSGFTQTKGNKEEAEVNPYSFYNLLSGMGVFDMSKPSYQRQARQDAKARYYKEVGGR